MKVYPVIFLSLFITLTGWGYAPTASFAAEALNESSPALISAADESTKTPDAVKANPAIEPASNPPNPANPANPMDEEYKEDEDVTVRSGETPPLEKVEIADPIEPFNRAMHVFNDKLYFWALKPVAQGYNVVVPEPARISVKNFFSNLGFPGRFVSCLLQADFGGAATEAGRFTINTVWGIGGLLDPAAGGELQLQKQDTDLGQTLGVWGVGQGFYIVWPILGPSSPRDSVTYAGEYFMYPVSYISPWYTWLGVRTFQEVNDTSLRIGDYEALKNAAIDPYIAFRDAYVQYRDKKIKARKAKVAQAFSATAEPAPAANPPLPDKGQ